MTPSAASRSCRSAWSSSVCSYTRTKPGSIEFGRFAAERREKRGEGKPETFDFLGFTHCCGTTRKGAFTIKRKSIAKRMRAKLQEIKEQLKRYMHSAVVEVGRGCVPWSAGGSTTMRSPETSAAWTDSALRCRLWLRVLRRRSQKGRAGPGNAWHGLIRDWLPNAQILHPYPNERLIVTNPR